MIKVIIADDEEKVCLLIRSLVDWKSLDMSVEGVAHNGPEALSLIKSLEPHLVITDIRMPGYDGLEIISMAKALKRDIDFIIISGHSQFEYAQSAIKFGVTDYLLKPIKKEELLATLQRVREKYKERMEQLTREEALVIRIKTDMDKLRAGFFAEFLMDKEPSSLNLSLDRLNSLYHLSLHEGIFQILIVKTDFGYESTHHERFNILENKIIQILHKGLKELCFDMELFLKGSRVYCFLNYSEAAKKQVRKQIKSAFDEILMLKALFEKIKFTMGMGMPKELPSEIGVTLQEAERAVMQRFILGGGRIIEFGQLVLSPLDESGMLNEFSKSIEPVIEVLDMEAAVRVVEQLRDKVLFVEGVSGEAVIFISRQAFNIYTMLLKGSHSPGENWARALDSFNIRLDQCTWGTEVFELLSQEVSLTLNALISSKQQETSKPIRLAKRYIQRNYMNPISLEEVSGAVGFNASYFSSLFKKESGQNFLEYVLEVRMSKAKELLKETALSVLDICGQVGYSDIKHFTKSFKKLTGLSPNEYRKIY